MASTRQSEITQLAFIAVAILVFLFSQFGFDSTTSTDSSYQSAIHADSNVILQGPTGKEVILPVAAPNNEVPGTHQV